MRTSVTAILALALLASAAVVAPGCGDEGQTMERPPDPRLGYAPAAKKDVVPEGLMVIRLKNVKWDLIAPHYRKFLSQKHATPKDAFRPHNLKFVPRPVIAEKASDEPEEIPSVQEEPRTPLQQYPLAEYQLSFIMSGTAVPKAVVVDPKRQAYVVQRDTRIGNKGGIVESITQYMVVVKEPNEEEPTKLQIKPRYIDLVSQVGVDFDEPGGDDEYAVPPTMDVPVQPLPGTP